MSTATIEPHLFVILGATGDLARRKLLPAAYRLSREGAISDGFRILGVARDRDMDDASYRAWAREALAEAGVPTEKLGEWCDGCLLYEPVEDGGGYETLGVVRAIPNSDGSAAEFAIVVRSDIKGQGLGWKLLEKMIRYCRDKGVRVLTGQVLRDNSNMLKFVKGLGFHRVSHPPGDDAVEVEIELDLS